MKHFSRAAHLEEATRPPDTTDKLYASDDQDQEIPHPIDPKRTKPKIHYGLIGSANTLLKDPKHRDALAHRYGIMAIEMEAAGIADSTWSVSKAYLVIRGI